MKHRSTSSLLSAVALLVLCTAASATEPAPEQAQPLFAVQEYRVLGNSALTALQIEQTLYPFLGPGKNIDSVEAARKALEAAYRDAGRGTVFVDIPEQEVLDGIVRLRVTEGRLHRVRVTGARYFSNGQIRAAVPSLQPGEIPDLQLVQAQLADLNRQTRDRSVTPVLRAGSTPGTVDVELKVQDSLPVHASFEVNDRYSADTSRTRASANLSYDNLFQLRHSLSLQYQTAPEEPSEAQVIAATYVAPVGAPGIVLAVYAVDTDSDVATVGTLSVLGAGRIYGARYIMPVAPTATVFHSVSLGADWKNFEENILLPDGINDVTPLKYMAWSAGYSGNWKSQEFAGSFGVSANFGIPGLGNDAAEFEFKRFKAQPNFLYWRANADVEYAGVFGTRWYLRTAGQFTTEPLISNEQFAIGGADSVRGYLESEELGDYGVSGAIELRSAFVGARAGAWLSRSYVFVFFDAGVARLIDALPGQASHVDLSSWGIGLRLSGEGGFSAALDWANPLVPTDYVAADDSRIHFLMRYAF